MSRNRQSPEELEFGSDSFLDIIANIVGILIILIVIAGVRMSQAPLTPPVIAENPQTANPEESVQLVDSAPENIPEPPLVSIKPSPVESTPVEPLERSAQIELLKLLVDYDREPQISTTAQLGTPQALAQPLNPQWTQEIAQLQEQQKKQDEQLRQLQLEEQKLAQQADQKKQQQQNIQQQLSLLQQTQEKQKQQQQAQQAEQAQLLREQANLTEQLVLIQRENQPAGTLRHSMVPLGRQVSGKEWHFEVREGKVSFIPLDELMGQVKLKVERWADWIAKYDTHESTVGPIEGFVLEYKVSRERKSLSEELTQGSGMFRISLDKWELIPSGKGYPETLEQAAQSNSMFRSTLNRFSHDDTITLWVYPDSFAMYHELTQIAHQMGYQVAARPLPAGRRIGGSPQGSKSVSQ